MWIQSAAQIWVAIVATFGAGIALAALWTNMRVRRDALQRKLDENTWAALKHWIDFRDKDRHVSFRRQEFYEVIDQNTIGSIYRLRPIVISCALLNSSSWSYLESIDTTLEIQKASDLKIEGRALEALKSDLLWFMNHLEYSLFPFAAGLANDELIYSELGTVYLEKHHRALKNN